MSGSRSDWEKLLPMLTAFVQGEPVQVMDYGGRWVDAEEVRSVLQGGKYRLKPAGCQPGVWTRGFTMRELGSVNGAVGQGILRWEGGSTDTPEWPSVRGMEFTSEPVFTPDGPAVASK